MCHYISLVHTVSNKTGKWTSNNSFGGIVSFFGQLLSAIIMALVGFIPGYGISLLLKKLNILRVPEHCEDLGIDEVEILGKPYPEAGVPAKSADASTNPEPQGA